MQRSLLALSLLACGTILLAGCRSRGTNQPETQTGAVIEESGATLSSSESSVTIELPPESSASAGEASMGSVSLSQEPDKAEIRPGEALGYTITLENPSGRPAMNLQLEDAFPVGKVTVLESRGGTAGTDRITWTIDRLEPGQVRKIRVETRASRDLVMGDVILNIVTVRGAGVPVTSVSNVRVVEPLPQAGAGAFTKELPPDPNALYVHSIR